MTSLRFLAALVLSQMRLHPGRAVITTLGVVASTCAVVWVVSGYDALVSQFDDNAGKYLGRYDALIIPQGGPPGSPTPTIEQSIIDSLQHDAGVLEINPISNSRVSVTRVRRDTDDAESESSLGLLVGNRPPVNGAPPVGPTLVSTPAADAPYELVSGNWLGNDPEARSVVVGVDVAQELGVGVGDDLLVTALANQLQLTVVGLVEQAPEAPALGGGGRGRRGGGTQGGPTVRGGREAGGGRQDGGPGSSGPGSSGAGDRGLGDSGSRAANVRTAHPGDPAGQRAPREQSAQTETNRMGLPSGFVQGIATSAIYVRPALASQINGFPAQPQVLQIAMRDTVSMDQFRSVWQEKLAASRPPLQLIDFAAVRGGMESSRSVSGQQSQAWAATGMASLAAIFIIFSTLSMGVSERARELAMMRAIALNRAQIAGIIAIESIVLALIGWVGGLIAGWLLVIVGSRVLPGLFSSGAVLGWVCVALTGITVLLGALGAAVLPAWRAMRIEPLDAMSTRVATPRFRWWAVLGGMGLFLAAVTPLSVFVVPMSDQWRKWCYSFITYPILLLGMILLAPAVVVICERIFSPLLTGMLRLDGRMMKTQLSSNLWRSVSATLALSVGLGLYASTQTWGYSMLRPFTPGDWLPDALVAFHPVGLDERDEALITQLDEVKSDEVMPLAIEQAKFDWGQDDPPSRLKFGDNGVICGLDPDIAFGETNPMLPVTFISGSSESVRKALASRNACVVSEDFSMATGRGVGDTITLIPPNADSERVNYQIAGIVSLPGWQWVTKFSGVRRHFVRTGTLIFANRERVQTDFHLHRSEFFWLNFQPDTDLAAAEAKFQTIAERHAGESFTADGMGEVTAYRPFARMTATETVRKAINMRADDMIWGMSYLPLVTLMIMSLAVANTVIASVRSRTWEFGVMRAVGVTRGQLVRLVVMETLLIGIAACVLSLAFGLIAGWCGVGMAQFGGWFAGPPSFMIPWTQLAIGFAMTIGLCLLSGLWPAIQTGRAEPLQLLQSGRATQ
ncbi:FtsX-like permease family protein [Allorhodopirellula heiligendammensis]|uniref:ABC transporter permease YtrF n=1 Tax=Allorhodopirellula heiligendammensis TaxID=2714739 RepID=A0A5C6BG49_9BACT|nr:FtsX-like permease family protein [Allorhodopirellula heiligendammensis]TWU10930.1 ABC transporter permease YtrF precursor [Allorhodopirellula heiligendammensis]